MENWLFAPQVIAGVKSILTSYPSDNAFHFWKPKCCNGEYTSDGEIRAIIEFPWKIRSEDNLTGVCVGWFKLLIV